MWPCRRTPIRSACSLFSQCVEERKDGLAVAAGGSPHEPSGVMIDHDREVALAFAMADLVDGVRIVRVSPTLVVTRWS